MWHQSTDMPDIRNFFGAKPGQGANTTAKPAAKEVRPSYASSATHLFLSDKRHTHGRIQTTQIALLVSYG